MAKRPNYSTTPHRAHWNFDSASGHLLSNIHNAAHIFVFTGQRTRLIRDVNYLVYESNEV